MSTAELKSNLYKLIESINDSKTLNAIYTLLSKSKTESVDWWDELPDDVKADIDAGLEDIKAGRTFPHEEVMREIKHKFKLR